MKTHRTLSILFLSPALAFAACEPLKARIADAQVAENCASPNKFCAAGKVEGTLGTAAFNGATFFTLDGVAKGPDSAAGYNSTSGLLVYTMPDGTMTVRESGIANNRAEGPVGKVFAALQEVTGGTGRYKGASGAFHLAGRKLGGGRFLAEVSGELCLP